jgi:hypothetical protein
MDRREFMQDMNIYKDDLGKGVQGNRELRDSAIFPVTVNKDVISGNKVIKILTESALVGFSLFLVIVLQNLLFDLDNRRFLIGYGEAFRMSTGVSFCYAFIYVLRRGYRGGKIRGRKDIAKLLGGYIAETYMLYMSLLFLARDVNFISIKLALGISFVASFILLYAFRTVFSPAYKEKKLSPANRKIVFKKSPHSSVMTISPRKPEKTGTNSNGQYESNIRTGKSGHEDNSGDRTEIHPRSIAGNDR